MTLKVHYVAIALFSARSQEVIKGNLLESRCRSKCRNVSANAFLDLIRANDHGQRVPADKALDAPFHLLAAGKWRLCL